MEMPDPWRRKLDELQAAQIKVERAAEDVLKSGDGGGTSDGMDPWQTSVETRLGQIHTALEGTRKDLGERIDSNFKWLLGAYGAGFVILAGMMVAGYLLLADKIAAIS